MTVSRSLAGFILLVLLLSIGCRSGGGQPDAARKAVEGWSAMRDNLKAGSAQVDRTLTALNQVSTAADLPKAYGAFSREVKETQHMAAKARDRAQNMRERSAEYVRKWEQDIAQVSDPAMRASMTARKKAISDNFAGVREAAQAASYAYQPFEQTLKDIDKALGLDLTPGGVKSSADAIARANAQGKNLKDRLNEVIAALDIVQGEASAVASPGPAHPTRATRQGRCASATVLRFPPKNGNLLTGCTARSVTRTRRALRSSTRARARAGGRSAAGASASSAPSGSPPTSGSKTPLN
jgi:hypothetical protein